MRRCDKACRCGAGSSAVRSGIGRTGCSPPRLPWCTPPSSVGRVALLRARSPLHRASDIAKPILIGHGANDVRCKVAGSDQIVAAMTEKHIPVIYVVYPDEGHGFARPENDIAFKAIMEAFLAYHLGGRAEPVGDDFTGFEAVLREFGIVAFGKHATRGHELDHVCAVLDVFADFCRHSFDAVGDAVFRRRELRGEIILIAMATGDA